MKYESILLDLKSIADEKGVTLCNSFIDTLKDFRLEQKFIGLVTDNCKFQINNRRWKFCFCFEIRRIFKK